MCTVVAIGGIELALWHALFCADPALQLEKVEKVLEESPASRDYLLRRCVPVVSLHMCTWRAPCLRFSLNTRPCTLDARIFASNKFDKIPRSHPYTPHMASTSLPPINVSAAQGSCARCVGTTML